MGVWFLGHAREKQDGQITRYQAKLDARVLTYEAAKAFDAAKKNPLFSPDPVKIMREAQENTKLPGASTCVLVSCDGTKIRAANLGDSGFRVTRGGRVVRASDPQEHYFNCPYQLAYEPLSEDTDLASDALTYEIDVVPGDLVVLGSDGLFDNVFDEEIAEVATAAAGSDAGAGALSAARASAEALARTARKHAEDEMEYTMTPGELKVQKPELIVHSLSITQENAPSFVLPDNKWSKPFRYKFSCVCNGVYVEFEFEQEDRIEYGQYEWPQAVERWLIPHLAKRPNV